MFNKNLTRITGTLHEDLCTFMIMYLSVLLRIRSLSDRICRENQNTHFMFNDFFFNENRAIYETTWKNMVEVDRPRMQYGACALHTG
jgi:hypothetical protein